MPASTVTCPACRTELRFKGPPPVGVIEAVCPRCGARVPLAPNSSGEHLASDTAPAVTGAGAREDSTRANTLRPSGAPRAEFAFLAPPQTSDEIGRLGPYRVLAELGRGGMGVVFRAEDPQLRRFVALKVMLPQFATDAVEKARFLREARAQAAVDHEHVAAIFQVGEDRGVPFLAMPLLRGQSLADALGANPRPPLVEAVRIAREVAEGLAAAHEKGLVHRDIKPGNVWLEGSKRRVKILDFGLARPASGDEAAEGDAITRQGAVVGTPAYMSPEQARGEHLDHRTDLFSLGCVLYQMLAGQRPFRGASTTAVLIAVVTENPPPPSQVNPEVPAALDAVVTALLAKPPDARPPSAEVAGEWLRTIEGSLSAPGVPPVVIPTEVGRADPWADIDVTETDLPAEADEPPEPVALPPRRRTRPLVALVAVVAVLVVGGAVIAFRPAKPKQPEPTPEEPAPVAAARPQPEIVLAEGAGALKRESLTDVARTLLGDGDPNRCPADLVAVFGDPAFRVASIPRYPVYSPDGSILAVPSGGAVVLFDTNSGKRLRVLRPVLNLNRITSADFTADGSVLVAGQANGRVRAWKVATGEQVMDSSAHSGWCMSVCCAPAGDTFLSGGDGGQVRVWKVGSVRPLRTVRQPGALHTGVAFSPNGRCGAAAARGQGTVFEVESGATLGTATLGDVYNTAVAFPNDESVVFGTRRGSDVFRLVGGRFDRIPVRHVPVNGQWLAGVSPDEFLAAPHDRDPNVALARVNSTTGESRAVLTPPGDDNWIVYALSKSRGELALMSADNGRYVQRADLATGAYRVEAPGHHAGCTATAFSPDGRWLATGGKDQTVSVWDAATGQQVKAFRRLSGWVETVAFDPTGKHLAAALKSGEVAVWRTETWGLATALAGRPATDVAFSADGQVLAVTSAGGETRLWGVARWNGLGTLSASHAGGARAVAALADGKFATAGDDRTMRVQSRSGGGPARWAFDNPVNRLAVSGDGKMLVAVTDAGEKPPVARVFNTADMTEKPPLLGHAGHIRAAALRPDGRLLVTGDDGLLIAWDLEAKPARRVVLCAAGSTGPFLSVAFAPDGRHVAVGTECGLVLMFRLPPPGDDPGAWMDSLGPPPRPGLNEADWEAAVAGLSAPNLALTVADRLRELNPSLTYAVAFGVEEGRVVRLHANTDGLTNLGPVRVLKHLRELRLTGRNPSVNGGYAIGKGQGKLTDLGPVRGLPLTTLDLSENAGLTDLGPVADSKRLLAVVLTGTGVSDLAPLRGQPLQTFFAFASHVSDLGPLASCPLEYIDVSWCPVRDLRPLKGVPVRRLHVNNCPLSDLTGVEGMPLEELRIQHTTVTDLKPLAGIPLVELLAERVPIPDLDSVRTDELEVIDITGTAVTDVARLRAAPLRKINNKLPADYWKERAAKKP